MDRRTFISSMTLTILAAPLAAEAQPAGKVWRIGFIGGGGGAPAKWLAAFHLGLRESGFSVGENVVIEYRWLGGRLHPAPEIASEPIRIGVDAIVAFGAPAVLSAVQATKTIPIVMVGVRNPVEQGIVDSLPRPGGNVTGIASTATRVGELHGKGFALFKEAVPGASRIAHLTNSTFPGTQANVDELMKLAPKLKVRIHSFDIQAADDVEPVFRHNAAAHERGLD
jgi:putative ABC transport system substrate-binding protein